jgi:hypothetical protein
MVTSNIEEHYIKTPFISYSKAKALKLKFISEFGDLSNAKPEFIAPPPPKAPRFTYEEERQFINPNAVSTAEQFERTSQALNSPLTSNLLNNISKITDPAKRQIALDATANILKRNNQMHTRPLDENENFISKFKKFLTGQDFLTTENILKSFDATNPTEAEVQRILLAANGKLNSLGSKFGEFIFTYCKNITIVSLLLYSTRFSSISPLISSLVILYNFLSTVEASKNINDAKEIIEEKNKEILSYDEIENLPPGELHDYVEGLHSGKQFDKIFDSLEVKKALQAIENTGETINFSVQKNLQYLTEKQNKILRNSEGADWFATLFEMMVEEFEKGNETISLPLISNDPFFPPTHKINDENRKNIQNTPGSSYMEPPIQASINEKTEKTALPGPTIYEKKEYSPLTFGYIEKTLGNIIEKTQLEKIMKYLKDNREITNSPDIRRIHK